jgi:hypothetical protein
VVIRLIEGSLVVWVVRVMIWAVPMSLINSDGIPKVRNVGEDSEKDPVPQVISL